MSNVALQKSRKVIAHAEYEHITMTSSRMLAPAGNIVPFLDRNSHLNDFHFGLLKAHYWGLQSYKSLHPSVRKFFKYQKL